MTAPLAENKIVSIFGRAASPEILSRSMFLLINAPALVQSNRNRCVTQEHQNEANSVTTVFFIQRLE